jgi:hypothetical protein
MQSGWDMAWGYSHLDTADAWKPWFAFMFARRGVAEMARRRWSAKGLALNRDTAAQHPWLADLAWGLQLSDGALIVVSVAHALCRSRLTPLRFGCARCAVCWW